MLFNIFDEAAEKACFDNLRKEHVWIQRIRAEKTFGNVLSSLRECCTQLHIESKCDPEMGLTNTQPTSEKLALGAKHGGDNIKAMVTLLGDNVIQAEVAFKHVKSPGGTYRGTAHPDVQWKLQQLQDLGNHIIRATSILCDVLKKIRNIQTDIYTDETGELILAFSKMIKDEIAAARSSILLPRKRSLLELCHFAPTRRFTPLLPPDQLLSFYISSCRLICAAYQIVPRQTSNQGLTIMLAECELPYLDDVLKQLNAAMTHIQKLIGDMEMCVR